MTDINVQLADEEVIGVAFGDTAYTDTDAVNAIGGSSISPATVNDIHYAAQYSTVQSAIDTAGPGSIIVLPPETINVSTPPLNPVSNQTLVGDPYNSVLRLPDNADTHLIEIADTEDNVTLRDFTADGNGANQDTSLARNNLELILNNGASNCNFLNLTITDVAKGAAIGNHGQSSGSLRPQNITIQNCTGMDGGKNGELCDFTVAARLDGFSVSDCHIENFTDTGVAQDDVTRSGVVGNVIRDVGGNGITSVKESYFNTIANNSIVCENVHPSRGGITIGPFGTSGALPRHVSVIGNIVTGSASWGLDINQSERLSIIGNSVYDNDSGGIHIRSTMNSSFVGNTIVDNGTTTTPAPGMVIENDGSRVSERNAIGLNTFMDTGVGTQSYGIELLSAVDNKNSFVGNTAQGHVTGPWDVSARENQRTGNYPAMPLDSGSVSLAAGGSQIVWTNQFEVGHPDIRIMSVTGTGQAQTFATTDGTGNTQYGIMEIGGTNAIDVNWAVFP